MLKPQFRASGQARLLALTLVLAFALGAVAVAAAPADATALRSAYDATTKAQSLRFLSTRTITVGTDTTPDVTFITNGEQVGQDRLHTRTAISSGSINLDPFESTQIGRDTYVHLTGALTPNGVDQWLQLDVLGGLLSGIISPIALQQASPGDALALLNSAADVQTVGDEPINGVNTTHLRGTLDLARATAGNGPLAGLGNVYGGPQSTVTMDVFIGKDDNLVRRLAFVSKADVDLSTLNLGSLLGQPSGAISTNAVTNATFDFSDFNATDIVVDPPTRYTRVSDYFNNFNLSVVLAAPLPTITSGATAPAPSPAPAVTTTAAATATATAGGTVAATAAGTRVPATAPTATVGR